MATTIIDSFEQSLAHGGVWELVVTDVARANCRVGWLATVFDQVSDSIPEAMPETSSADIGDTSDVSFSVDKSGSLVRLCCVSTGSWTIKANRRLLCL